MAKRIIQTNLAPEPLGPYNQAIEANGTLYVSGQIPIDPSSGLVIEGDIVAQTSLVMKNLGAVLEEASYKWDDVCKCTIFMKDLSQFVEMNNIYAKSFSAGIEPARECVEVSKLPKDVLVEISLIASK